MSTLDWVIVSITATIVGGMMVATAIKAIWFDPEHGAFMWRITKIMLGVGE